MKYVGIKVSFANSGQTEQSNFINIHIYLILSGTIIRRNDK